MESADNSKQIRELLVTVKSLLRATEVCLTGVRTDEKDAQELIDLARQLTRKAHLLIEMALPNR